MTTYQSDVLLQFNEIMESELRHTLKKMSFNFYKDAYVIITEALQRNRRVHFTGIGKPSYIARYAASLFSSVGTASYFLDGTEAVHGSSGQVQCGDVVIAISNSGKTRELLDALETLKRNGAKIIAVCSDRTSPMGKLSDACLEVSVQHEGGPLNKAPRASYSAALLVLQGLSVLIQTSYDFTLRDYKAYHPGGTLGASIQE